ncbi:MAG: ferritin-like domain-containing protein [Myxococcales bacterium]|nr:ferritin-like domain-containing protein [Myxococcales bacterium]
MTRRTLVLVGAAAGSLVQGCSCGGGDCTYVATLDGGSLAGFSRGLQLDAGVCAPACRGLELCSVESATEVRCTVQCIGGRAPPGLQTLSGVDGTAASWLARMGELEGAAVAAFLHLADELDAHGLSSFAQGALGAARDEVRHARALTGLALSFGAAPRANAITQTPVRSLFEVALDNAAEGCGRERFGAHVNVLQAAHAEDAHVRAVMHGVASDELAHARFSESLDATLRTRLTVAERRRLSEAREQALLGLASSPVPEAMRRTLGLPDVDASRALVDTLLH